MPHSWRTLLVTPHQVSQYKQLVAQAQAGEAVDIKQLQWVCCLLYLFVIRGWFRLLFRFLLLSLSNLHYAPCQARTVCGAVLHPDTGKPILWPFRMAAHVPMNVILLVGMLSSRQPAASAFWQFANQSFNVTIVHHYHQ